jgi:hypothetical protein
VPVLCSNKGNVRWMNVVKICEIGSIQNKIKGRLNKKTYSSNSIIHSFLNNDYYNLFYSEGDSHTAQIHETEWHL